MSQEFASALGQRIRAARKFRTLTQEVMAERLEVAASTLNKYERGHRIPDAELLARIVDLLGCDAAWLLMGRSRFFTGEPLDERYVQQGSAWVKDDSRMPEIDPAIREIVDWAAADPDVKGAILYIKEKEIRPYVEKKLAERSAALEPPASKAG